MTDEARWRQLRDLWWEERREPQPGDLEVAWSALWDVIPTGWTVTQPS